MQDKIYHQNPWVKTKLNTPIELYKKTHNSQRPILFIGGVHGDEPEGVQLAMDLLNWLIEQDKNNINLNSWILIPCLNPDGFRKNERVNSNGVDLNRNFPSRDWMQESKAPRYYPGPFPGSEIEVSSLVELIQETNPYCIIHFHSWKPCVVYTGESGKIIADIIAKDSPYESRPEIGYPTPGSLGQYGWLNHQIPVICIEEQENGPLEDGWKNFGNGLIALMKDFKYEQN